MERSGQKKVNEQFTEVILQNPLFLDLDPTIQGLPLVLHAVSLTRETGKHITRAGKTSKANLGIGQRP
jgi:hypothetical protein